MGIGNLTAAEKGGLLFLAVEILGIAVLGTAVFSSAGTVPVVTGIIMTAAGLAGYTAGAVTEIRKERKGKRLLRRSCRGFSADDDDSFSSVA